jgi:hypothetical protein
MTEWEFSVDAHPEAETGSALFRNMTVPLVIHPRGWAKEGHRFHHVARSTDRHPHIHIQLVPQKVMDQKFPQFAAKRLSVCNMKTREVYINESRWKRSIPDDSGLSLPEYRAYVITHEVGHALGKQHETCKGLGHLAPVMMQQTLGVGACTPSPWA